MRIWIGSWNCEQQFPTATQINAWVNHATGAGAAGNCDVIVMGFQESSRNANYPASVAGCNVVSEMTAEGQTKNVENCQRVLIYQRPAAAAGVGLINPNNPEEVKSVVKRNWKKKIKFWAEYGKGSANTLLLYRPAPAATPWRIVLSSAHLDSKSAAKRNAQIADIVAAATTLNHGNPWDVHFFFGDLNFRVRHGNMTQATFCAGIGTPGGRAMLYANDSFNIPGWTWPDPIQGPAGGGAPLALPSYKLIYKPAAAQVAAANAAALLETGGGNAATHVPLLYAFKTDANSGFVKPGSRDGEFDMGWLDRIGFRVNAASARTVTHVHAGTLPSLNLSDHAPVYSVFTIT